MITQPPFQNHIHTHIYPYPHTQEGLPEGYSYGFVKIGEHLPAPLGVRRGARET